MSPAPIRSPFPLIVGCPRSGTTLVRGFLDAHPDVAIPGETDVVVPLLQVSEAHGYRLPVERIGRVWRGSQHVASWGLDVDAVLGEVEVDHDATASAVDATRLLYDTYARSQGKARGGDKTPYHARHLPVLTRAMPEARVVHVIRDPRSVAAALRSVEWSRGGAGDAARTWCRLVAAARGAGATLGPDRYLEIRYEDLVAEPEQWVGLLCRFLDLPFDEAMLDRRASAERARAMTDHPGDHANLDGPLRQTRDWREELTGVPLRVVESIAGELMLSCGYTPTIAPRTLAASGLRTADIGWVAVAARAARARRLARMLLPR